jgi:hypothetical protein
MWIGTVQFEGTLLGEPSVNDTKPRVSPVADEQWPEAPIKQIVEVLATMQKTQTLQTNSMEKVTQWIIAADAKRRRTLLFLSYRFNESSRAAVDQLQRLFRALDVDIVTGEEYEPRSVSHKIRGDWTCPWMVLYSWL